MKGDLDILRKAAGAIVAAVILFGLLLNWFVRSN